ncbi:MAG: arsenate reductase ArsC [Actinobacteria bacterium]|nr:arsenate reductase ArsC [Actinomycetota bacterium]
MRYVLFVCTQNAGRSQMAEAFFTRAGPKDLRAESAGQLPAKEVHPAVVEAMAEVGIDISGRIPKKLTVEMQLHADWAITLACGGTCPYVPSIVEDWKVADPAGKSLEEVRVIRDDIRARVERLLVNHVEDIRADRTAHEQRLARLLPVLDREFAEMRTGGEIRACADAVLDRLDDAPITTHIMTLARKRATECLRADECYELAGSAAIGDA